MCVLTTRQTTIKWTDVERRCRYFCWCFRVLLFKFTSQPKINMRTRTPVKKAGSIVVSQINCAVKMKRVRANYSAYLYIFFDRLSNFKWDMLSHLYKKMRAHNSHWFYIKTRTELVLFRPVLCCLCVGVWSGLHLIAFSYNFLLSHIDIYFPLSINRSISHGLIAFPHLFRVHSRSLNNNSIHMIRSFKFLLHSKFHCHFRSTDTFMQ